MLNDCGQPIETQIHTRKVSTAFLSTAMDLLKDSYEKGVLEEIVAARLGGDDDCQVHHFLPGMELGVAVALAIEALGAPCGNGVAAGMEYGKALLGSGLLDLKLVEIIIAERKKCGEKP